MTQDNLTNKQLDDQGRSKWAVFLPAISGFYSAILGDPNRPSTVDATRLPQGLNSLEDINWLNSNSLFPYKWSLYSGGHAALDLSKDVPSEYMVRNRSKDTMILGDSGGFQIGKGRWPGDWRANSGCKIAGERRRLILNWLDNIANYSMTLDVPSWSVSDPVVSEKINIRSYDDAVKATEFNNEYFIANRLGVKNGGTKFLNVLQGSNHTTAEDWYQKMKKYCDPTQYPDKHFDGWAMGGQNCHDIELALRRLVALKFDGLLQEGVHDWMHFLGLSKVEWALMLTCIQNSIREHVNPNFTVSFDCASPFLATANGQIYSHASFNNGGRWRYSMTNSIDDKKYSTDSRSLREVALNDFPERYKDFTDSPISSLCKISDICCYNPGVRKTDAELNGEVFDPNNMDHYHVLPSTNKLGKVGKTSWDTFSYGLQMAHNVWLHIDCIQKANMLFEQGHYPKMLRHSTGDFAFFKDIIDEIFTAPTRELAISVIERYSHTYWLEIVGTRGLSKASIVNAKTNFAKFFEEIPDESTEESNTDDELDATLLETLETDQE